MDNSGGHGIYDFASKLNQSDQIVDDIALVTINLKKDVEGRQNIYKNILESYNESIRKNLIFKGFSRFVTWALVLFVFISISIKSIEVLEKCISLNIENQIPVVISSLVSLLTVVIVIPKIISEYIFNKEEDQYAVEILKTLLDFDKSVFK